MRKYFLETFAAKAPQCFVLAALVVGRFQCGKREKSGFAHASPSHPEPTPTAKPQPIFRQGVRCSQVAQLC